MIQSAKRRPEGQKKAAATIDAVLIPIGSDRPLTRATRVTHALIALNVLVFLADLLTRGPRGDGVVTDSLVLSRDVLAQEPWRLLGYAFAHADHWHILGNMLFLWVFGPNVEDRLGRLWYAVFYLFGAAAAGATHLLFSAQPVVGASGAVAAVTGAYLVLFPRTVIRTLVIFILIGVYNIPAAWFLGFAIARDVIGLGMPDNVAREAHLGGYAFGAAVSFAALAAGLLPREVYDLFQIVRQQKRRNELREAVLESQKRARATTDTRSTEPPVVPEPAMLLRAEVSGALSEHDAVRALDAYRRLMAAFATNTTALTLNRTGMLAIGNHALAARDYPLAARAYELFLDAYPRDPERAHVKLMLGLIKARYLNEPETARPLITDAAGTLQDDQHAALARELLDELNARTAS